MRRARRTGWVVLAALLVVSLVTLLARDGVVSFVAGRALAKKGFDCDLVSVHVPLPPSTLELAGTRCKVAEGPLEWIEFKEPLFITLDGLSIGSLVCGSLEVNLRPFTHKEVTLNTLGDLTRIAGVEQQVIELMFDSATLSADVNPPLFATHAVLRLGGKEVTTYEDLKVVSTRTEMTVTSPSTRLAQPAVWGPGVLRLTASPTAVTLKVAFADFKIKIVLDHVDATRPTANFDLTMGTARPDVDEP